MWPLIRSGAKWMLSCLIWHMSMHMTINFMRFLINWLSGRLCDEEPLFYMIRCIDPLSSRKETFLRFSHLHFFPSYIFLCGTRTLQQSIFSLGLCCMPLLVKVRRSYRFPSDQSLVLFELLTTDTWLTFSFMSRVTIQHRFPSDQSLVLFELLTTDAWLDLVYFYLIAIDMTFSARDSPSQTLSEHNVTHDEAFQIKWRGLWQ